MTDSSRLGAFSKEHPKVIASTPFVSGNSLTFGIYCMQGRFPDDIPDWFFDIGLAISVIGILWSIYLWARIIKNTKSWQLKKISLLDVFCEAQKLGWKFGDDSLEIIDLCYAIKQSASEGNIILWGRENRNKFESLNRNEILEKIPAEHWKDSEINWQSFCNYPQGKIISLSNDNFDTSSYTPRDLKNGSKGYKDIYFEGNHKHWLKKIASKYKGQRQQQEKCKKGAA